jgi:hypothetical protein
MANIGIVAWIAPNPFGEPTAYLMVYPTEDVGTEELASTAKSLGLRSLDTAGDIMWIGTDTLVAALRAMQIELWTGDKIWLRHTVTDDLTGAAIARRYAVLVVGTAPLDAEPDAEAIAAYLSERQRVFAGLVRLRLRMTDG